VRRHGARAGEWLYVTGPLGGSIIGRHLTFSPRVALARELASRYRITSMIDLSDGLSRDVGHLCDASGLGAAIDSGAVPVHMDVDHLPPSALSRVEHALHDGEDYELLFTSPDAIPAHLATRIGTVTAERDVLLDGAPLKPKGWQHTIRD
jgi:thiamine-monophosphate kinase